MGDERIARAQAGDKQAFSELVLQYQSMIRGYLARKIYDPDEVFDVAQEVFLAAWRNLPQFDLSRDFAMWLRGVARHHAVDYLRDTIKRRAREICETEEALMVHHAEMAETEGEEDYMTEDRLAVMGECVEKMKERGGQSYDVLTMRYFQNISSVRIGEQIGKKQNAVRILLMRLRQTLKDCIEQSLRAREGADA